MGSSVKMPTPPPPPQRVDAGKEALDFIQAMADPALQNRLLQAEKTYRPEYTELELADINTLLRGTEDQAGLLDLQDEAAESASKTTQRLTSAQREADIADVETLGDRATEALRSADPMQKALLDQINQMSQDQFARSGRLTPEQMRNAQQQARLAGASRGRVGDQSTVASEILNREAALQNRRREALQTAQLAFGMNQATSADPFQVILGRPAQAPGMGMASSQFAAGLAGQQLGPNLFNPDAGINLGLLNQANLANYQSSIYGSQAGFAGAKAQARGAMIGGIASGLGALGGGFASRCWVAREVFGSENPMWVLFRQWLDDDSPNWFFNLYIKHGKRFAQFISNKPFIKRVIRKWMTSIVERKFTPNPTFI